MQGKLDPQDLRSLRQHQQNGRDSLKAALAMLRRDRKQCAALTGMPGEVITHLDEAIDDLVNALLLELASLALAE